MSNFSLQITQKVIISTFEALKAPQVHPCQVWNQSVHPIRFDSIRFNPFQFDSVQSIRFNPFESIHFDLFQWQIAFFVNVHCFFWERSTFGKFQGNFYVQNLKSNFKFFGFRVCKLTKVPWTCFGPFPSRKTDVFHFSSQLSCQVLAGFALSWDTNGIQICPVHGNRF